MASPRPFWAFISYNHEDERHARWLHTWLEGYRTPKKLVGSTSERLGIERPDRLKPIYRDREEFSAGQHLGEHVKLALGNSRNLIVVCSPHAVRSRWVDEEIRHYQSLGLGDRIFCLVVDGDPNAGSGPAQCMPAALRSAADASGIDALAADIRPGKDKPRLAALRLAAGMLDLRFDELRQRDQERRLRQLWALTGMAAVLLVVMGLLTFFALQQRDEAKHQRDEAKQQKTEAQKQTRIAVDQQHIAETQTTLANQQTSLAQQREAEAKAATGRATESEKQALASELLAKQRQQEAEAAQRATQVQFEDATLRRIAAESRSMLDGSRAGGALMAVRLALAGMAIKPRADQFGTLQVAQAAGDDSLRAWGVQGETISAMALSPDGSLIAAATGNARSEYHLRFWNARGAKIGEPVGMPIPMSEYVTGLVFTPDGKRVVAVGTNRSAGSIRQWDVATGRAAAPPVARNSDQDPRVIAISPTGDQWLTASGFRGNLVLWNAARETFTPRELIGHTDSIWSVAFSPDGRQIVSSSEDQTIRLWSAATGQAIGEPLRGHTGWATSVAFSPDGQTIASSSHDKTIRLWRLSTGAPVASIIADAGEGLVRVRFSPDGKRLAAASEDGFVRLWDAAMGKPLGVRLMGHRGRVGDLAFSLDGTKIFSSGTDDGTVRVWDGLGAAHRTLVIDDYKGDAYMDQVNSIAFAPGSGGHRLAATNFDGTLRQWDADTGQPAGPVIQTPRSSLNAVTYSADGQRLFTASSDGVVRAWYVSTGRAALPPMRGHDSRATAVAASRDGKLLASADEGGDVILWDAAAGKLLRRMSPLRDKVWSVGFSPDGQRLAASGAKGLFVLWDIASGKLIHQAPEAANSALPHLAFSPDGRFVATANRYRKTLDLWDGHTGRPIERNFIGHGMGVDVVAFSPDGHFIASGSMDQTVRLWALATGEPVGTPVKLPGLPSGLAFSADGMRLAAGSINARSTIQVWDGPAAWAPLACQRLTRNLSVAEWAQYVGKEWRYLKQCPDLPGPAETARK